MSSCSEVLAALEEARRALVRLAQRGDPLCPEELDELGDAVDDLASLAAGVRELDGAGALVAGETLPDEYVRVAVESAMEAMRRGDSAAARGRAEIALWTARRSGADQVVWLTATLLDLITARHDEN